MSPAKPSLFSRLWPAQRRLILLAFSLIVGASTVALAQEAADSPAERRSGPTQSPTGPVLSPTPLVSPAPTTRSSAPWGPPNVYAADGPGDFSPAVAGVPARVYVPVTLNGTIVEIDPRTFRIVHRFTVGGQPHHVTPSWDLRTLYVDNPATGTLRVIDPRTGRLGGSIRVASPYNLYYTPDGTKALVISEYNQEIEFRDPRTWRLIKRVSIPWPGVDHMDFTADGRSLVVSCEYSGVVVRVDTQRMRVTGVLHVGGLPIDVKLSPDGRVFYVGNQGLGGVSVIDAARFRLVGFIPTGPGAHGFAVSRDTRDLYVSNRLAGSISVISFAARRVVATWHVGGSPDMLQVSPDGTQLWTSNRFGDTVSVISTTSGKVIRTIVVGPGPHGLAYFPQPGRFSLGHNGVYR